MYTLLLLLLLIDCVALMVVVLLQAGKGGGLAAGFGGAGTGMERMGSRQTATFLHSATKWLGGAFLVICFAISLLTVRGTRPRSLIEEEMRRQGQAAPPAAEEAGTPTELEDILGGEPSPGAQPAEPAAEPQGSAEEAGPEATPPPPQP